MCRPVSYTHLDVYKRQLEETDLFLQRFLRSEWTLVGTPTIGWNDIVLAFDISDLVVRRVS